MIVSQTGVNEVDMALRKFFNQFDHQRRMRHIEYLSFYAPDEKNCAASSAARALFNRL